MIDALDLCNACEVNPAEPGSAAGYCRECCPHHPTADGSRCERCGIPSEPVAADDLAAGLEALTRIALLAKIIVLGDEAPPQRHTFVVDRYADGRLEIVDHVGPSIAGSLRLEGGLS